MTSATLTAHATKPDLRDVIDGADLRRRRRRELVDDIIRRAALLPPADGALLRLVFEDGRPVSEVCALRGGSTARGLRRRVRILVRRVLSDRFRYVLVHRDQWPTTRRRVATRCVIEGRPIRDAAAELGLSVYAVRRHKMAIDALCEGSGE
ncbi:MAG: hypothetical protein ACKVU4_14745 [Phycisphaerales bacterium]